MKKREIIDLVKKTILRNADPSRIYLFGSQIDGNSADNSDLDLAYDAPGNKNDLVIKEEIAEIQTLIKIDVVNISKVDNRFRNRVIDTGKVIWSATKLMRFEDSLINFRNALGRFKATIESKSAYIQDGYGDIFLDIAVKRFEFTFEMAWKSCKRALDYDGFECKSPRECLREAFAQGILEEENTWLDMLEQRNLSAHVYDEVSVGEINTDLTRYLLSFTALEAKLTQRFQKESENKASL
jgi:nucleotidyltransferase substrate binding protein (TIGR01987 family)